MVVSQMILRKQLLVYRQVCDMGTPVTYTPSTRAKHEWYIHYISVNRSICRHCGIIATSLNAMSIADRFIKCQWPNTYHNQEVEDIVYGQADSMRGL